MNLQLLLYKVFHVKYIKGHQSQHKKPVKLKIKIKNLNLILNGTTILVRNLNVVGGITAFERCPCANLQNLLWHIANETLRWKDYLRLSRWGQSNNISSSNGEFFLLEAEKLKKFEVWEGSVVLLALKIRQPWTKEHRLFLKAEKDPGQ